MAQAIGSKPPSVKTSLRAFWLARDGRDALVAPTHQPFDPAVPMGLALRGPTHGPQPMDQQCAQIHVVAFADTKRCGPRCYVRGAGNAERRSHRKGAGPPQKVPEALRDARFSRAMAERIAATAVPGWGALAIVESGVARFRCDSAPGRRQGTGIPEKAGRWLLGSAIMGSSGFAGY